MVLVVATLVVPLLLFMGASWLAYAESRTQAEERIARTLDLLYVNVRTAFETDYLVAANVAELTDDYTSRLDRTTAADHARLGAGRPRFAPVEGVWVMDEDAGHGQGVPRAGRI
jgi:hypothetical protein